MERKARKGAGNVIISIVNFFIGGILFAIGVEAVREFCALHDSASAAWGGVSMGVIFMMAALIVLFFAFLGIYLTVRGEGHHLLSALATVFLLAAWILLPLSGMVAEYYYNAAAPYVRVSAERAATIAARGGEAVCALAAESGDAVFFYDGDGGAAETFSFGRDARAEILPLSPSDGGDNENGENDGSAAGKEAGKIVLSLSYDARWHRLTFALECSVPLQADKALDGAALERAVGYVNVLSARPFTAQTAAETAAEKKYADYAWDGYDKQLRAFDPFVRIESGPLWEDAAEGESCFFGFYALVNTGLTEDL